MSKTEVVPAEVETVPIVPTQDPTTKWGPFKENTIVNTQWGDFAVPRGHIMHFEMQRVRDKKNNAIIEQMMPVRTKVRISEEDTRPSVPLKGKTDKENLDNVMAYSKMNRERQEQRRLDRELAEG